jgi:hypothetical protein
MIYLLLRLNIYRSLKIDLERWKAVRRERMKETRKAMRNRKRVRMSVFEKIELTSSSSARRMSVLRQVAKKYFSSLGDVPRMSWFRFMFS